jgi:hypothetical protein
MEAAYRRPTTRLHDVTSHKTAIEKLISFGTLFRQVCRVPTDKTFRETSFQTFNLRNLCSYPRSYAGDCSGWMELNFNYRHAKKRDMNAHN